MHQIAKIKRKKNTILYSILAMTLCCITVYLYKRFKPIDYTNPLAVLKEYRELSTSSKNLEKIYDYIISDEDKKLLTRDEFVKIKTSNFEEETKYLERVITELPFDNSNSTYRRFTVREKESYNGKVENSFFYYTLKNENGKWKIVWTGKLLRFGADRYMKGDYSGAIKTFEQLVTINPYDGDVYRRIADCYSRLDKNDDCLKYCKLAITLEPENKDVYNSIAGYYNKVGNTKMDIQYSKRALKYCLNEWEKSTFYSNISNGYLALKDFTNAENYAKSAINSDSTNTYAWFKYGEIKHTQNDWQVAKKYYCKAITLSMQDPTLQVLLYANYASCCLSANECDSAKKYSMKALDLFPESKSVQDINEKAQNCK